MTRYLGNLRRKQREIRRLRRRINDLEHAVLPDRIEIPVDLRPEMGSWLWIPNVFRRLKFLFTGVM